MNQQHSSISTVQLSPFGEDQWNRIVTYSPIYVHWTDMILMSQHAQQPHRAHKISSGKLKVMDPIDINSLKLEDELLLNEIQYIRKSATIPSKDKQTTNEFSTINHIHDHRETSLPLGDDYQTSSNFSHELKEPYKHYCSYVETPFADQQLKNKRPVITSLTTPNANNIDSQVKKLTQFNLGPKPHVAVLTQLRHSAIARELSSASTNDHRSVSPLSVVSTKRNIASAHSNRQYSQQKYQASKSSLSNEIPEANLSQDPLPRESSPLPRAARARSTTSNRSTLYMLKTKNERKRQKQQIALKTLLVDPWKLMPWNDGISDEAIPNSLDIMNKMCGPATPFERNLRYNYHRQLNQLRNLSAKS